MAKVIREAMKPGETVFGGGAGVATVGLSNASRAKSSASETAGSTPSDRFHAWVKEQGIKLPENYEAQTDLLARFLQSTESPKKDR